MNTKWVIRWLAVLVFGGAAYLGIASTLHSTAPGVGFHVSFPRDLAVELLGHTALDVVVSGVGVVITLWGIRKRPEFKALGIFFAIAFVGLWTVIAPLLFPRFFVWVIPAVAVCAALGLHRLGHRNVVTAVVIIACLGSFLTGMAGQTTDEIANRSAVPVIAAARAQGQNVCGLGYATEALGPYAQHVPAVFTPAAFADCDVLIALVPTEDPVLISQARSFYTRHRRLSAQTAGIAFWN